MEAAKGELVPGGLAMVYGLVRNCDVNGSVVELVIYHDGGMFLSPITGDLCNSKSGWHCIGDCIKWDSNPEENGHGVIPAKNLLPINPEADPLETTQEHEKCQTL